LRKSLLVGQRRQHIDERHRSVLVGIGQGGQYRFDGATADLLQLGNRLLRLDIEYVAGGLDLRLVKKLIRNGTLSALAEAVVKP
jgi:hypothetical protein